MKKQMCVCGHIGTGRYYKGKWWCDGCIKKGWHKTKVGIWDAIKAVAEKLKEEMDKANKEVKK